MIKVNFVSNLSQHLITKMGDSQKVSLLKRRYLKINSTTYILAKVDTTTTNYGSTFLLYTILHVRS